jgi:hypothetical protein
LPQEPKFKPGDSVTARYDDKVITSAVVVEHQTDPQSGVDYYYLKIQPAPFDEFVWLAESTLTLNED